MGQLRICPIPGCENHIPPSIVLCRPHWYQVPKELRAEVYATYRDAPGSPAHLRAVMDAVHSVRDQ